MVNQWGRDGNLSSGGARSSGGAGILIAAIVAVIIGAGGGYGAARFLSGVSTADLASRDQTISELRKQISTVRQKQSGAQNSETVLQAKITDLQAEVDALGKTLADAGDLQNQLNRAKKSQTVSERQILELEGNVTSQQNDIAKLRRQLASATAQGSDGNKVLSDQIKTLEAALEAAQNETEALPGLKKQIADFQANISTLKSDNVRLKTQLADAVKQAGAADGVSQQLTDLAAEKTKLEKDLATSEDQLAGKDSEISGLKARMEELRQAESDARGKASVAEAQRMMMGLNLGSLRTEKEKLENDNAGLRQTIKTLQGQLAAAKPVVDPQPSSGDDSAPADSGGTSRDSDMVRNALADMPGFSRLTTDKQADLAARLENGDCVADALKIVLGRVPAIALRNLIRDLGSKC